jgi:hypothetical protein
MKEDVAFERGEHWRAERAQITPLPSPDGQHPTTFLSSAALPRATPRGPRVTIGGTGVMVLGALAAGVAAVLLALATRRLLGTASAVSVAGLLWSLVAIGLVTLAAFEVLGFDQRTLNVLLFVPAGMFLVLAVGRWWSGVVLAPLGLAALAAYSLGIELVQLQLARLDRACDVTDMVDNVLGAGIGFAIGLVLLPVVRPWRGRRPAE